MSLVLAASVRAEVADFVSALFGVYVLILVAWIVAQLIFSLGVSVPFSRPVNAVLDFLRDCAEPWLRIFRRLGLRIGPFDLSPIVAILVLQVARAIIVGILRG
jgi:YggT family protein